MLDIFIPYRTPLRPGTRNVSKRVKDPAIRSPIKANLFTAARSARLTVEERFYLLRRNATRSALRVFPAACGHFQDKPDAGGSYSFEQPRVCTCRRLSEASEGFTIARKPRRSEARGIPGGWWRWWRWQGSRGQPLHRVMHRPNENGRPGGSPGLWRIAGF